MEFFFPASAPLQKLRPVSGTITIDSVKGQDDDKRYRLQRVVGKVDGTFVDKSFVEHSVKGTFEYVR